MVCDSVCSVANPLLGGGSTLDVSNMYWLLLYQNTNCVQVLVRFTFFLFRDSFYLDRNLVIDAI